MAKVHESICYQQAFMDLFLFRAIAKMPYKDL